ncbi:MAG: hypothetical protein K0R57_5868 [Paenibacillaceae bacterium]|nr:hypothetical protein [Paenibacillaceae bacterium]
MAIRRRSAVIRAVAGILILLAGALHSLYYLSGLGRGWEQDWWNLLQLASGVIVSVLGLWIIIWRSKQFSGRSLRALRAGQILAAIGLLCFLLVEGLIWSAGRSTEPQQSDYLLILGARVRGETVSLSLKERLDQGLVYLRQYPDTPVILSGGQGTGEEISEAEAMKRYLIGQGVAADQLILEDRSRDTYQNLSFSRELLEERGVDLQSAVITLVTNDFHMFRAEMLAKRVGLQATGLPSRTPEYTLPKAYTREFAALVKSYLMDR